uniref:Urease accessory protein UreH-like transmembrane domain-containing protein n=1 Tax=Candidatus Kentrum sp. SD TaxID=2126332 RepID=A0A451BRF7_9GAMM|nr:MAG: hypothetical protein BECKSD772F_GA0070984_10673 [Candidatus Kentron sp. SD]VFK44228.1 MAG: hypothetical protein BECKSD772E_GA0070983_103513 [Candidatus Kentron sp. SD]VFK80850.1 MAG: hypothetical protein BECKSD772D_GA0070982_11671 [Candidatus Kentron sp. SD]
MYFSVSCVNRKVLGVKNQHKNPCAGIRATLSIIEWELHKMESTISPFVISTAPYLAAFLAGLLGGVHCIGMCGGIIGALSMGLPAPARKPLSLASYIFSYNAGRIFTYALAGAVMGWSGNMATGLLEQYQSWLALRILAALFMIAMGLYLGGWWFGLATVERGGGIIWRWLSPIGNRLLPVKNLKQALLLGVVWGWLPCGLVYSFLIWALAAGGWREGALFMISFGLGTLPTLMGIGFAASALQRFLQRSDIRRLAGLMVVGFGILTLVATVIHRPDVGLGCYNP